MPASSLCVCLWLKHLIGRSAQAGPGGLSERDGGRREEAGRPVQRPGHQHAAGLLQHLLHGVRGEQGAHRHSQRQEGEPTAVMWRSTVTEIYSLSDLMVWDPHRDSLTGPLLRGEQCYWWYLRLRLVSTGCRQSAASPAGDRIQEEKIHSKKSKTHTKIGGLIAVTWSCCVQDWF